MFGSRWPNVSPFDARRCLWCIRPREYYRLGDGSHLSIVNVQWWMFNGWGPSHQILATLILYDIIPHFGAGKAKETGLDISASSRGIGPIFIDSRTWNPSWNVLKCWISQVPTSTSHSHERVSGGEHDGLEPAGTRQPLPQGGQSPRDAIIKCRRSEAAKGKSKGMQNDQESQYIVQYITIVYNCVEHIQKLYPWTNVVYSCQKKCCQKEWNVQWNAQTERLLKSSRFPSVSYGCELLTVTRVVNYCTEFFTRYRTFLPKRNCQWFVDCGIKQILFTVLLSV